MIGEKFSRFGNFSSGYMILGIGSILFAVMWHCLLLLLLSIMSISSSTRRTKAYGFFRSKLFLSEPIVLMQLAYLIVFMCVLINYNVMENTGLVTNENKWANISNVFTIIATVVLGLLPWATIIKLTRIQCNLADDSIDKIDDKLIFAVKTRQNAIKTWEDDNPNISRETAGVFSYYIFFYLRRILFASAVVYMKGFAELQLILLVVPTLVSLVIIAEYKPMVGRFFNGMEAYSNGCTLALGYSIF